MKTSWNEKKTTQWHSRGSVELCDKYRTTPFRTGIGWSSMLVTSYINVKVFLFQLQVSAFFQGNDQMFVHKNKKAIEGKAHQKEQRCNALIKNIWFDLQDYIALYSSYENTHREHDYDFEIYDHCAKAPQCQP